MRRHITLPPIDVTAASKSFSTARHRAGTSLKRNCFNVFSKSSQPLIARTDYPTRGFCKAPAVDRHCEFNQVLASSSPATFSLGSKARPMRHLHAASYAIELHVQPDPVYGSGRNALRRPGTSTYHALRCRRHRLAQVNVALGHELSRFPRLARSQLVLKPRGRLWKPLWPSRQKPPQTERPVGRTSPKRNAVPCDLLFLFLPGFLNACITISASSITHRT